MNLVVLTGRLGGDPDVRFIPNGTAVANFRIATTDTWRDRDGQRRERTEWHNVVVWGKLAETCGKYLAKGRQVTITGSLHTRQWEDREKVKRYMTEVTGQRIEFLDSTKREDNKKSKQHAAEAPMSAEDSQAPEAELPPEAQYAEEANAYINGSDDDTDPPY